MSNPAEIDMIAMTIRHDYFRKILSSSLFRTNLIGLEAIFHFSAFI